MFSQVRSIAVNAASIATNLHIETIAPNKAVTEEIAYSLKGATNKKAKIDALRNCLHLDDLKKLEQFSRLNGLIFSLNDQSQLSPLQLKIKFSVAIRKFFSDKSINQSKYFFSNPNLSQENHIQHLFRSSVFSKPFQLAHSLSCEDCVIYLMDMEDALRNFSDREILDLQGKVFLMKDMDENTTLRYRYYRLATPYIIENNDLLIVNPNNTLFQPQNLYMKQ